MYVGLRSPGYSYPRLRVVRRVAQQYAGVTFGVYMPQGEQDHQLTTASPFQAREQLGNNSDGPRVEADSLMLPRYLRRADFDIVNEYLVASLAVDSVELQHVGDHPIGNFRFQHERFIDKHPPTTFVADRSNAISSIRRKSEVFLSSSKLLIIPIRPAESAPRIPFRPGYKKALCG